MSRKNSPFSGTAKRAAVLIIAATAISTVVSATDSYAAPVTTGAKPTIVLVHGAWADGSSWAGVTTQLQAAGYTVDVPPNPLRGVADDARSLQDYLATISGPVILVGHSYGGMVITDAATGNANVKALVYVDAYIPKKTSTVLGLTSAKPGSTLDPATTINQVQLHDAAGHVTGVDLYVKPASFPAIFAAGIPAAQAQALAAAQRPLNAAALTEPFPVVPAWQTIPSWDVIGTADKLLPPAEQEAMAVRAGSHITKIAAPHLSMVANPTAVTGVITTAATATLT